MKPSELLQYLVAGVIIGLILLLLVTQLLGQPAIVFVETGSMSPTLEPNDGYVAVPAMFAGEIEVGDVILFQSQELGGGELTTHRVVDITDEGYITQGDANPFTDQSGDEPPVADGQIRSVALQPGGEMVVIPGLGASVGFIRSAGVFFQETVLEPVGIDIEVTTLSTLAMIAGLLLFIYGTVTGAVDRHSRSRSRGGLLQNAVVVIAILTLVVIIPINVSMLLPSGVYQFQIISSESPTESEQIIGVGESGDVTYRIQNSGHLPVLVFLEPAGDGVTVNEPQIYVPRRTTVDTSITMQAPDQTGSYLRFVREYRYLVVLPPSLITSLHSIHPALVIVAINLTVGGGIVLLSLATVGTERLRFRSRKRELELSHEIRRRLPAILLRDTRPSQRGNQSTATPPSPPTPKPEPSQAAAAPTEGSSSTPPPEPSPTAPSTPELTEPQQEAVAEFLSRPPSAAGYDADSWTPQLLQRELESVYGVEYPLNRCVKLLKTHSESGGDDASAAQPPASSPPESESSDRPSSTPESADSGSEFGGEFGEPAILSDTQLVEVHQLLQEPPTAAGYEETAWTPELVQSYIQETYAIEYPIEKCEQLVDRA